MSRTNSGDHLNFSAAVEDLKYPYLQKKIQRSGRKTLDLFNKTWILKTCIGFEIEKLSNFWITHSFSMKLSHHGCKFYLVIKELKLKGNSHIVKVFS